MSDSCWPLSTADYLIKMRDEYGDLEACRDLYEQKWEPESAAFRCGYEAYGIMPDSRPPESLKNKHERDDYRSGYMRAADRAAAREERRMGKL